MHTPRRSAVDARARCLRNFRGAPGSFVPETHEITEGEDGARPSLIVTGSSAGGIDALMGVVAHLPDHLDAAIIVGQHLDPVHESRLAEILAQRSALPVVVITGLVKLVPGTIYVVPPSRDVEVVDGEVRVFERQRSGPKPSIDKLFKTAAVAYGERLIAVILSGMGSDGLAGARVIKQHGGTVLIQDPATASHPSMPMAIPPNLVDLILVPERIGPVLSGLLKGAMPPDEPAEQRQLRTLLTQVRERTGIDFLQYKTPTIMRRLARLMVAGGIGTISEYLHHLQNHPDGFQRLANSLLIKVTEFFRDAPLFEELRENILPNLIAQASEAGRELRIWSAGSSTGEEPYSIAILCAELLRGGPHRVNVRIFATDLDHEAIAFARQGVYPKEALRHVSPALLERYFVPSGETYEISKLIRNMTVFGQHDLGQRAPFPRIDLCTCRNVLIYFTRELQVRALQLFAFSLREGGYLILGKAETTSPLPNYFKATNGALKIYQRHGDRMLIPPTRIRDVTSVNAEALANARLSNSKLPTAATRGETHLALNEVIGAAVTGSGTGVVVIDRKYDIIAINAAARALLDIIGVGIGDDLVHLAKGIDSNRLRTQLDSAFRNEKVQPADFSTRLPGEGKNRWLRITVYASSNLNRGETVTLIISDISALVSAREQVEERYDQRDAQYVEAHRRLEELAQRLKELLVANEELSNSNGDLRSTNEHLLIGAEEAASASEEVETLNEEMQATNEELETLNEELQATVEELNTTNDELQARGAELEETTMQQEATLERLEFERKALARGLEEWAAGPVVVFENERILYCSEVLDSVLANDDRPGKWQEVTRVELAGVGYKVTRRLLAAGGTSLTVVTLHRE